MGYYVLSHPSPYYTFTLEEEVGRVSLAVFSQKKKCAFCSPIHSTISFANNFSRPPTHPFKLLSVTKYPSPCQPDCRDTITKKDYQHDPLPRPPRHQPQNEPFSSLHLHFFGFLFHLHLSFFCLSIPIFGSSTLTMATLRPRIAISFAIYGHPDLLPC